jgi:hypothetical protein
VVLWAPQIYFNHCNIKVCCPLCQKPASPHGWSDSIRRICGLYGTYYLCGSRFKCTDCAGGWVSGWHCQQHRKLTQQCHPVVLQQPDVTYTYELCDKQLAPAARVFLLVALTLPDWILYTPDAAPPQGSRLAVHTALQRWVCRLQPYPVKLRISSSSSSSSSSSIINTSSRRHCSTCWCTTAECASKHWVGPSSLWALQQLG